VESVAWVTERKDVLSAFFWMLTLCLYVYYTEKPVIKRYLLVLFGFICALMSKPMVVTLPVVMILLDYWPLKRFESKKGNIFSWQLKEKMPFFILSAVLSVVTLYDSQKADDYNLEHFPFISRLANATVSFVTYLEKTFWPHDMAVFYPFPAHIPLWQILGATLLILVISVAVIVMAKRLPYLFVGWMWFTITILPVTGIIYQIWLCAMADRYHYLPSIGIAVMMAWGIPFLFPRENMRKKILFPVGIAFLIIMSFLSWQQCRYWKNSIELWNHALKVTENNYQAHNNIGLALFAEGRIDEAIGHYNKAISITRDANAYVYNFRGAAYSAQEKYQLAINDYNKAISIYIDYFEAYNNRGIVYANLGYYQLALEDFNKAVLLNPDFADAYSNSAFIYYKRGNKFLCCTNAKKACEYGKCEIWKATVGDGLCR
jgi:tetratricopeptide (TPR) repeat protein